MNDDINVLVWMLEIFHHGLGRDAQPETYTCVREPVVTAIGKVVTIDAAVIVDEKAAKVMEQRFTLSGLPFSQRRTSYPMAPDVATKLELTATDLVLP